MLEIFRQSISTILNKVYLISLSSIKFLTWTDLYESVSIHREASQSRREQEVLDYHLRRRTALCL